MKTIAVVPAYREEDVIANTVRCITELTEVDSVVVADDSSGDGTAPAAAAAGARVIVHGRNYGKGGSLNRVLAGLDFDALILLDGDLGRCAAQAPLLLDPVLRGEADLAIAAFPPPAKKGGLGIAQGLGRRGIRFFTGRSMRSPLSGQRAMTHEVFSRVFPFDPRFGVEVGMTIDALRAGFRVVEVETEMSHKETGRDAAGFLHRARQFYDITMALAKRALSRGC